MKGKTVKILGQKGLFLVVDKIKCRDNGHGPVCTHYLVRNQDSSIKIVNPREIFEVLDLKVPYSDL